MERKRLHNEYFLHLFLIFSNKFDMININSVNLEMQASSGMIHLAPNQLLHCRIYRNSLKNKKIIFDFSFNIFNLSINYTNKRYKLNCTDFSILYDFPYQ